MLRTRATLVSGEVYVLITKQQMLRVIETLPDDAGIEEAIERLYVLHKLEVGIAQADAGQTVSHEEARRLMARWLQ
jgi:hypothetical protein